MREEVREALRHRAEQGAWPEIVVLPREIEGGAGVYSEIAMYAVKDARAAGIQAEYLHAAADRRYLGEHSAEFLMAIAVSFAADLGANGLQVVGKFMLSQLRSAVRRRLIGSTDEARLEITAAVVDIKPEGTHIEELKIAGTGEAAVLKLLEMLSDATQAAAVARELGIEENDEQ